MELVKQLDDFVGMRKGKFYKEMLFRSEWLLLGVNCLNLGRCNQLIRMMVRISFVLWYRVTAVSSQVVWAPAGFVHGVENIGNSRLTLLIGIAPAP